MAPASTWTNTKFGGGGYVTGLIFHPTTQNVLYARTDVGGAYRWNPTTSSWTPITDGLGFSAVESRFHGVESLAVVATAPENARLYFKFRPTKLRLAADPELATHRAYGVPKPEPTPEMFEQMETIRINPTGELPEPLPISQIGKVLQERDGYVSTPADQGDVERQWPQLKGLFLIDRGGIVRWSHIECEDEGLAGIGKFPSEQVILDAARACSA